MLDYNEKPFIHLKAQAFVCQFLFEMIFTDLALGVINPFIIKTFWNPQIHLWCLSKTQIFPRVLRGQISEISNFLKTVGGGRSTCWAGSSTLWHSPGIWTFQFYAGPAGASFHQCGDYHRDTRRFSAKTDILLVLWERRRVRRAQPGGPGPVCLGRPSSVKARAGECHIYFNSVDNNKIWRGFGIVMFQATKENRTKNVNVHNRELFQSKNLGGIWVQWKVNKSLIVLVLLMTDTDTALCLNWWCKNITLTDLMMKIVEMSLSLQQRRTQSISLCSSIVPQFKSTRLLLLSQIHFSLNWTAVEYDTQK